MKNINCKIIIASHKVCQVPSDEIYQPVLVGASVHSDLQIPPNWVKDDNGENISSLNPYFCELTGLYWAWKNLSSDYIGLVHYRRFFSFNKNKKNYLSTVLSRKEIDKFLGCKKIFVPNKRKYYIETIYSHYCHNHYSSHLDISREIISDKYPEYISSFDKVMKRRWAYMFNMMIMKKDLLDDYCSWLFDILFELQKRISPDGLSKFQARFYGRVSELLFNVWLENELSSKKISIDQILEIPCIHADKVNWIKKMTIFLAAKFLGIKPTKSC